MRRTGPTRRSRTPLGWPPTPLLGSRGSEVCTSARSPTSQLGSAVCFAGRLTAWACAASAVLMGDNFYSEGIRCDDDADVKGFARAVGVRRPCTEDAKNYRFQETFEKVRGQRRSGGGAAAGRGAGRRMGLTGLWVPAGDGRAEPQLSDVRDLRQPRPLRKRHSTGRSSLLLPFPLHTDTHPDTHIRSRSCRSCLVIRLLQVDYATANVPGSSGRWRSPYADGRVDHTWYTVTESFEQDGAGEGGGSQEAATVQFFMLDTVRWAGICQSVRTANTRDLREILERQARTYCRTYG